MGGRPKGLERVGADRIIDRVASSLKAVTSELALVANDQNAHQWLDGVRLMSDKYVGFGGLSGVQAALSTGRDALVVAWDMPFVDATLLRALLDRAVSTSADVVVPESDSPYGFEPFCAFYCRRVLKPLEEFLATGGGAARDFLATLPGVYRLPISETRSIGEPARLFLSVNTEEELEQARAMASASG